MRERETEDVEYCLAGMTLTLGPLRLGQEENGELNSSQSNDVINSLANRKSMTSLEM